MPQRSPDQLRVIISGSSIPDHQFRVLEPNARQFVSWTQVQETDMALQRLSLVVLVMALAPQSLAQKAIAAAGPLAGLNGTWSGSGAVTLANGERERIRCRAAYDVRADGSGLRQTLDCASDSYRFSLKGDMQVDPGGAIAGSWTESTRNAGGSMSGLARDGSINGMIEGTGFSGALSVTTHGDRQSLSLLSQGEVRQVAITLRRAGR